MTTAIAYSPLHAWHQAHAATFADYGPWRLASVYSDVAEEQAAVHSGLALADLSALGKIRLEGNGLNELLHSWFGDIKPGSIVPLEGGRWGWTYVLSENQCLWLSSQPADPQTIDEISRRWRADLVYDMTSALACMDLLGPKHGAVLRQLTSLNLDQKYKCVQTGFAGVPSLLWWSPGSTRILVAWDLAEYVWERVWQIGQPLGMIPLGMEAYLSAVTRPWP
jgi:glycine cleavage system aminomethyltransferase T